MSRKGSAENSRIRPVLLRTCSSVIAAGLRLLKCYQYSAEHARKMMNGREYAAKYAKVTLHSCNVCTFPATPTVGPAHQDWPEPSALHRGSGRQRAPGRVVRSVFRGFPPMSTVD